MPAPEDYVAGAVVANAIAWIVTGLLEVPFWAGVLFYAVGSVLAGFLVARRSRDESFWKVGLKSGMGAFVLHMFSVTAVEIVMKVITWPLEAHVTLLSIFLSGGVFGALLLSLVRSARAVKKG